MQKCFKSILCGGNRSSCAQRFPLFIFRLEAIQQESVYFKRFAPSGRLLTRIEIVHRQPHNKNIFNRYILTLSLGFSLFLISSCFDFVFDYFLRFDRSFCLLKIFFFDLWTISKAFEKPEKIWHTSYNSLNQIVSIGKYGTMVGEDANTRVSAFTSMFRCVHRINLFIHTHKHTRHMRMCV